MSDTTIADLLHAIKTTHAHEINDRVRAVLIEKVEALPRAIFISDDQVDPIRARAAQELCTRIHRVMSAPPDVWATGDIIGLLGEAGTFVSFYSPVPIKECGQLPPDHGADPDRTLTGTFCLPVDRLEPAEVLQLFRAFVVRNATQWQMGAGDHHHPIWEHVAVNVDGVDPTDGPRWAYIQPLNRKRLTVLEVEHAALMDAREAEERGG